MINTFWHKQQLASQESNREDGVKAWEHTMEPAARCCNAEPYILDTSISIDWHIYLPIERPCIWQGLWNRSWRSGLGRWKPRAGSRCRGPVLYIWTIDSSMFCSTTDSADRKSHVKGCQGTGTLHLNNRIKHVFHHNRQCVFQRSCAGLAVISGKM